MEKQWIQCFFIKLLKEIKTFSNSRKCFLIIYLVKYLDLIILVQFESDSILESGVHVDNLGKGKDVLISNLSKKIGDLRSKIYDPVANKRMCYGFRDWEIIKDERRLDYSQIVRSLFGIRSRYLASVDVSGCISRCFFCWVDWENEDSFENRFYSHEEIYGKLLSLNGNIWRFTGGEPLIVPESPLEICGKLHNNNLRKVFWLETNLLPLIKYNDFPRRLSEYERVVVHCSIKGADSESFEQNTGLDGGFYGLTMLGLKSLINNGIEVFPSLLVNNIPPVKLKFLFNDLLEIHPKLPLRVMIRRVLPYAPIVRRMEDLKINLYSFDECLQHWKQLIAKNYGTEYLKVERWKIKL